MIYLVTIAFLTVGAWLTVNKAGEKENICDYSGGIEK